MTDEEQDAQEERDNQRAREYKVKLLAETPTIANHPKFKEYEEEAEHLEGLSYWMDYFKTSQDLVDDFNLYIENID